MPDTAFNRVADNWRPLFAIAEVAGGDWPMRAANAFIELTLNDNSDAQGIGTMLLVDIAAVFEFNGVDRLGSAQLTERLADIEGRPWAEFRGFRKITPNQLAKELRPFGIGPHGIRVGDTTPRGYLLTDFTDAFERYLPNPLPLNRNSATDDAPDSPARVSDTILSATKDSALRPENDVNGSNNNACGVVAPQKPAASNGGLVPTTTQRKIIIKRPRRAMPARRRGKQKQRGRK